MAQIYLYCLYRTPWMHWWGPRCEQTAFPAGLGRLTPLLCWFWSMQKREKHLKDMPWSAREAAHPSPLACPWIAHTFTQLLLLCSAHDKALIPWAAFPTADAVNPCQSTESTALAYISCQQLVQVQGKTTHPSKLPQLVFTCFCLRVFVSVVLPLMYTFNSCAIL